MATKKAGGSSRNGRDSAGRRLGVKKIRWSICYTWQYNCKTKRNKNISWRTRWYGKRSFNLFLDQRKSRI